MARLGVSSTLKVADAKAMNSWHGGDLFDAILLDGPCSGTGVISRHPDIKLLRRPTDIKQFADELFRLLKGVWQALKPGGYLLYSTCSIFSMENDQVVSRFLKSCNQAMLIPISHPLAVSKTYGIQFVPSAQGPNGLYYSLIQRK